MSWRVFVGVCIVAFLMPAAALHGEEKAGEQVAWWLAADSHVGYLVGRDSSEFTQTFVREMNRLNVDWTYVLGNHDFDKTTKEPLLPLRYGAQTVRGIRFIMLSDETPNTETELGDEQKAWFWNELATHRGTSTPIFLFTHATHRQFSEWDRRRRELDDYNIAAWFSGQPRQPGRHPGE